MNLQVNLKKVTFLEKSPLENMSILVLTSLNLKNSTKLIQMKLKESHATILIRFFLHGLKSIKSQGDSLFISSEN